MMKCLTFLVALALVASISQTNIPVNAQQIVAAPPEAKTSFRDLHSFKEPSSRFARQGEDSASNDDNVNQDDVYSPSKVQEGRYLRHRRKKRSGFWRSGKRRRSSRSRKWGRDRVRSFSFSFSSSRSSRSSSSSSSSSSSRSSSSRSRPCPTTAIPVTAPPTSSAPTTGAPTTASPTTGNPTTASPTTGAPTTATPTTGSPTSVSPTTATPTVTAAIVSPTVTPGSPSAGPTTASPTTLATTASPTTASPTTAGPTTLGPTTASPTTGTPTTAGPTAPTTTIGQCVDNPRTYNLNVDVQIQYPDDEFAACDSQAQDDSININIQEALNENFATTVTDWQGTAVFGAFVFDAEQEVNNVEFGTDDFFQQRRNLQTTICPIRTVDCSPAVADYCRWGCLGVATTDCNPSGSPTTSWVNLAQDIRTRLAGLGYDCLGIANQLQVVVTEPTVV